MEIKGIKKAIGEYKRANAGGAYSARYGKLMLDRESGEVWTDEYYDLGHGSYTKYSSMAIVNLGAELRERGLEINMANAKTVATKLVASYVR